MWSFSSTFRGRSFVCIWLSMEDPVGHKYAMTKGISPVFS